MPENGFLIDAVPRGAFGVSFKILQYFPDHRMAIAQFGRGKQNSLPNFMAKLKRTLYKEKFRYAV